MNLEQQLRNSIVDRKEFLVKLETQKSAQRLLDNVLTKLTTTFIGSIVEVENGLGILWGKGKRGDDLSSDEIVIAQLWKEIRKKILDLGNAQKRAIVKEIQEYEIKWNKYRYNLKIVGEDESNE